MSVFYTATTIRAEGCNVTAPPVCSLSPFSVYGYANALTYFFNNLYSTHFDDDFSLELKGISFLLHNLEIKTSSKAKIGYQEKFEKGYQTPGLYPKICADCFCTIVLKMEEEDIDFDDFHTALQILVARHKFISGNVIKYKISKCFFKEDKLKEYLQTIEGGKFYQKDNTTLTHYLEKGFSPAKSLIWGTQIIKKRPKKEDKNKKEPVKILNTHFTDKSYWRSEKFATLMGYQLLEMPKERPEIVRNEGNLHAFAEPCFGIMDLLNKNIYCYSEKSMEDLNIFMQYRFEDESKSFTI